MFSRNRLVLALFALGLTVAAAPAADKETAKYLTDKGELKESLVVCNFQSGFAGQVGPILTIETNGDWRLEKLVGQKVSQVKKGKLTKTQLATLAKEMAKYDLASLQEEGMAAVNPHTIQIRWGENNVTYYVTGQRLPPADPKKPAGRYSGIVAAVNAATKAGL